MIGERASIMLRRVPGDPSTMIEIDTAKLEVIRNPSSYKWVQYAEVAGSFSFPVDMLRYDCCAPVNFSIEEDDIGRIKTVLKTGDKLIVGRIVDSRYKLWTDGRWHSFCWGIKSLTTLPFKSGE